MISASRSAAHGLPDEAIAAALGTGGVVELDRALWPGTAGAVHALGWERAQRGEFTDPALLVPVYIRLPEAEELWNKRHEVGRGG